MVQPHKAKETNYLLPIKTLVRNMVNGTCSHVQRHGVVSWFKPLELSFNLLSGKLKGKLRLTLRGLYILIQPNFYLPKSKFKNQK